MNAGVIALIKDSVSESILNHESRIEVDAIDLLDEQDQGYLLVKITYTIRQTNTRSNYVFPYYIKEGTYVE